MGPVTSPQQSAISSLSPGRVFGLVGSDGSGLTSLGMSLLAEATENLPVAVLDVRGWFCPSVAWEAGIDPDRLVVVRCPERTVWPQVAAALIEGFQGVFAEVPRRVPDQVLRRLGALARNRRCGAVIRPLSGDVPPGVLHLRIDAVAVRWEGPDRGHGRLGRRVVQVRASGKGASGIDRYLEVEGDGSDALRLVPGLAVAPSGRAAG